MTRSPLLKGGVLVIVLLGFCWYAVGKSHTSDGRDFVLDDFLVREILPDEPPLLVGADHEQLAGQVDTDHRASGLRSILESSVVETTYGELGLALWRATC